MTTRAFQHNQGVLSTLVMSGSWELNFTGQLMAQCQITAQGYVSPSPTEVDI